MYGKKECLENIAPRIKKYKEIANSKTRVQAWIQEKNEPPQNFPVSRFYPLFPRFLQRFPNFSLTVNFSRFASANAAVV